MATKKIETLLDDIVAGLQDLIADVNPDGKNATATTLIDTIEDTR